MKLSAAFNFFDGGELLVAALKNIRNQVDHISIVTQNISNYGNEISAISKSALDEAILFGLVDDIHTFTPNLSINGGLNEFQKRAIGISCALEAGDDHIMFCDVDEFYEPNQFAAAKRFIIENNIDYSTVAFQNYYVKPTWKLIVGDNYNGSKFFVPFICKLTRQTSHNYCGWYPINGLDPTRVIYLKDGKHHLFDSRQIIMHHLTGVRLNIEEKLLNSSCNDDPNVINQIRNNFALLPHLKPGSLTLPNGEMVQIVEVADLFGLTQLFLANDVIKDQS